MIFKRVKNKGFTLVEIVVSLMIFSVVAVVALGALVKIISVNKKAQTLQSSITNLSFALESMSREMRVGSRYRCAAVDSSGYFDPGNSNGTRLVAENCPGSANLLAFEANKKALVGSGPETCRLVYGYFLSGVLGSGNYSLKKAQQSACGDVLGTTAPYTDVIDPSISITSFFIGVNALEYPLGLIHITGYSGANQREKERSYFELETAISSRIP